MNSVGQDIGTCTITDGGPQSAGTPSWTSAVNIRSRVKSVRGGDKIAEKYQTGGLARERNKYRAAVGESNIEIELLIDVASGPVDITIGDFIKVYLEHVTGIQVNIDPADIGILVDNTFDFSDGVQVQRIAIDYDADTL